MVAQSRYEVQIPSRQLMEMDAAACTIHTLDTVMQSPKHAGLRLTNADAHRLAESLSIRVLRLHDTPWLRSRWSNAHVSAVRKNGTFVATHPFVSCALDCQSTQAMQISTTYRSGIIQNTTLSDLRIILIELCMRATIDKLHTSDELDEQGSPYELSQFMTAKRLLQMEEIQTSLDDDIAMWFIDASTATSVRPGRYCQILLSELPSTVTLYKNCTKAVRFFWVNDGERRAQEPDREERMLKQRRQAVEVDVRSSTTHLRL